MKRSTLLATLIAAAALAAGCGTTVPADPQKMSPEQLQAWAKDRNATASCVTTDSLWAKVTTTWVVLDRGTISAGSVAVGADCSVTISATPAPARPASAP